MANIKISQAADAGTLLSSDMLPLARSGDTNAYHATMSEVAAFTNVSVASGAYNNVGRSYIHNGLMNIAQRGAGSWTTTGYTLDRWVLGVNLDAVGILQVAANDGMRSAVGDETASYLLQNVFTGNAGAAAYNEITQYIENVRRLAGKTVTLSFFAVASVALRLGMSTYQWFGTGGSPSAPVNVAAQSVALTTTWARYSVTFALPSMAGKTLGTNNDSYTGVQFWFSSGATNNAGAGNIGVQSGTVQLWGVQLEVGSVATPLEKLDPQQDLAKCQRFYELQNFYMGGGATAAGLGYGFTMPYVVPKRGLPTITLSNVTITNLTSTAVSTDGATNVQVYGISVAAGGYLYEGTFAASADL